MAISGQKLNLDADSLYQKNTIVLKLKNDFRKLADNDKINSISIENILQKLEVETFERIFPNHRKPMEETDIYGNSLVDLSLIYQLKYRDSYPVNSVVNQFLKTGLFDYVERRPLSKTLFVPDDSLLANQYYHRVVKAFQAWDIESGDSNVVIGMVDTGTDIYGEDLKDGISYNYSDTIDGVDNDNDGYIDNFRGWDLGMNDNVPMSYWDHHGCFTTGIAAARVNNHVGIAGLGYKTRYLPVRVCDDNGYMSKDYEGIVYAADHGSDIINNSWGAFVKTSFGQDIVNYATFNHNALVVASTGNNGNEWLFYPASFENVISCAATDSQDVRWIYSSYGTTVDICAPGVHVFSTWTYNEYFASSGTSFSAPGVSAAAALLKAHFPNLSALQIGEQLRVTADNIDTIAANASTIGMLGSGRLNIYKALTDTSRPSIRFRNRNVLMTGDQAYDTIRFSGEFVNFLHKSSSALTATLSSNSPYLSIVNPVVNLGQINTLGTYNNNANPFIIKILANVPAGTEADVKITYSDTNYSGFEYFRFQINKNFADLDTNDISATISPNSLIGYANIQKSQGEGFNYKNPRSLLSWAGLVVGNAAGKVSSNIYGDNGIDADFQAVGNFSELVPPVFGDQNYLCEFNDNLAAFNKLNISVRQNSYAYHSNPKKVIFLNYVIRNNGILPLSNLYVGIYADFDIDVSYKNKAYYDSTYRMAYTLPTQGGKYAGIMMMDSVSTNVYNFDNDGSENSVNIYDGFLDYEKFIALKGGRDSAGSVNISGNDVSTLLSTGPFNLMAGDSLSLTFAMLAGDHLYDLRQSAQQALNRFYNVTALGSLNSINNEIIVSPNPFSNKIVFSFEKAQKGKAILKIYDSAGKEMLSKNSTFNTSDKLIFDVNSLPKGIYFYTLNTDSKVFKGKIVK